MTRLFQIYEDDLQKMEHALPRIHDACGEALQLADAAVSAPVAAPARHLEELIGRYWDLAYAEGKEGREHDTKDGAARQCWGEIQQAIGALSAAPADSAMDAERYRFLFTNGNWCRDPLWPLVRFFRDGDDSITKADVDAAIDAARALTRQGDTA